MVSLPSYEVTCGLLILSDICVHVALKVGFSVVLTQIDMCGH